MKHARRLRAQMEDWKQMWRQVDAFVDRLESARDQDAVAARKSLALLGAAGALERVRRACGGADAVLGDPVVAGLPTTGWDADKRQWVGLDAWSAGVRTARLPGADEIELAAANLASSPGSDAAPEAVWLAPVRGTLTAELDGHLQLIRVPSYPGTEAGGAGIGPKAPVSLKDDQDSNLFPIENRRKATLDPPPGPDEKQNVVTWSDLVRDRRLTVRGLDPRPPLASSAAGELPVAAAGDATALEAAAQVLDEEGVDEASDDLADRLRTSAAAVRAALPHGGRTVPLTDLFGAPPEIGDVGVELSAAVAERLAYPGGSLRILRMLEVTFAGWWPGVLQWMALRARRGRMLDRALRRFLAPFVTSLQQLVTGQAGAFVGTGMVLPGPVSVAANRLVVDAPAALAGPLAQIVEAGQLVVLPGERTGAALVLGVTRVVDRLAFVTTPLRVSLVPPDVDGGVPGLPGQVAEGTALAAGSAPIGIAELRRGYAQDPARDGLVEQAVALASQLALLLGRVEAALRLAPVVVPEPPGPPLQQPVWWGEIATNTASFVLHGVPEQWWDRSGPSPLPLLARPGELLLLRGTARDPDAPETDPDATRTVQTVIEVDRAVWLPGSALEQLDTSRTALLATDPAVLGRPGQPSLLCAPRDDLVLLTVRRTWQTVDLSAPITLRRDFAGFDLASLAVGHPLGDEVLAAIGAAPGPAGVDRELELGAAAGLLDDWTAQARG
ncbi:hypothetical protein [Micromonospora sp. NPDC005806]|uniref:hypothetical protein n=1 Tax=Micromonospora sp. NPDC005806 TaxID=3364234 RepID=UPI00369AC3FD